MKTILNYLNQLGFSDIESKLYLLLLKSDPMTVAELAEAAKINRTATYTYIDSLLQKGIIAKVKGSSNKIAVNPPEHLQYLVEQKLTNILALKETLPNIVNVLKTSFPQTRSITNSETKYYKGKTGVKAIYEECLKTNRLRSYFNADDIIKIFPENAKLFKDALINNSELIIFEILEASIKSTEHMKIYKTHASRHFHKFFPKDVKLTSNDILIYDDKVAIINVGDKNNVTGVVLHNKDYYNNSVQLFDLLWRLLPESKLTESNFS